MKRISITDMIEGEIYVIEKDGLHWLISYNPELEDPYAQYGPWVDISNHTWDNGTDAFDLEEYKVYEADSAQVDLFYVVTGVQRETPCESTAATFPIFN